MNGEDDHYLGESYDRESNAAQETEKDRMNSGPPGQSRAAIPSPKLSQKGSLVGAMPKQGQGRRNSLVSQQSSVSGATSYTSSEDTFGRSDASSLCFSDATTTDHVSLYSLPSAPIRMTVREGLWSAVFDNAPITQHEDSGMVFESGINVKMKLSGNKRKLILRNDERKVMTVCNRETVENGCTAYRIYACRPILFKQRPAKKTSNSRMGLYEWAEVIALPCASSFSINIWNGSTFVPHYMFDMKCSVPASKDGGPDSKPSPWAYHHSVRTLDGETVMSIAHSRTGVQYEIEEYEIEIQPQVDPCLMICFSTIIDDAIINMGNRPSRRMPPALQSEHGETSLQELAQNMSAMMANSNVTGSFVGGNRLDDSDSPPRSKNHSTFPSNQRNGHQKAQRRRSSAALGGRAA